MSREKMNRLEKIRGRLGASSASDISRCTGEPLSILHQLDEVYSEAQVRDTKSSLNCILPEADFGSDSDPYRNVLPHAEEEKSGRALTSRVHFELE